LSQHSSIRDRPVPLVETRSRLPEGVLFVPPVRSFVRAWSGRPRLPLDFAAAHLLDIAIAANVLAVLAVVVFGGFDIGIWSASGAAKPALILMLTIPVRRVVRSETALSSAAAGAWRSVSGIQSRLFQSRAVRDSVPIVAIVVLMTAVLGFLAHLLEGSPRPDVFPISVRWKPFFEPFVVWDGGWYFTIASAGYHYTPGVQSPIAFFPLYPLLVRTVAWPLGSSPEAILASGIAISSASFAAALVLLHRLTVQLTGSANTARRAVMYLAVFPFSFYFTRFYSESLFLLLTVSAVTLALRSRWLSAGMVGALAAATRPNGIVIALPLLFLACTDRPQAAVLVRRLGALSLASLGPLAYSAYVFRLTGDPLMWLNAQEQWGYSLWHAPTQHLVTVATAVEQMGLYRYLLQGGDAPYELLYAIVAVGALALVPRVASVCGAGLAAYVLASILIPLSGNSLVGTGRYVSVLFPLFIALATLKSRRLHEFMLVVSSLLLAVLLVLFVRWQPLY
jgi:hypothetical protein